MLQGVFVLACIVILVISFRLWLLYREHQLPGNGWWLAGCVAIGAGSLLTGVSAYVGEWARTFAPHVLVISGFGALWLGVSVFGGKPLGRLVMPLFNAFLCLLTLFFYWFWQVDPDYQMRLTGNCLMLGILSLAMCHGLLSLRVPARLGTTAGVLYMTFALFNVFRSINIILFPEPDSIYLSNMNSKNLMVAMMIVLVAALAFFELLIRDALKPPQQEDY